MDKTKIIKRKNKVIMKKAIAMKCTQENWDSIKGKLDFLNDINDLDARFCYLVSQRRMRYSGVNFYDLESLERNRDYEIHETFNAKIFLEACGIEFEKKFEITKEQIETIYADGCTYVKDWFPEVFKKELEVGKWYIRKHNDKCLINFQGNESGYGFGTAGFWAEGWRLSNSIKEDFTEATPQEVETALIWEIKKRYPVGTRINCLTRNNDIGTVKTTSTIDYYFSENDAYYAGVQVFAHGKFATIIETITIQEAEKLLKEQGINRKIV